ncbi:hypothetical protein L218DRAFT_717109 [Marasmius fiardii PR-910]|nr:hypothetical protein L218DRAFT_717109 [Marasmius fiardii PR-910]
MERGNKKLRGGIKTLSVHVPFESQPHTMKTALNMFGFGLLFSNSDRVRSSTVSTTSTSTKSTSISTGNRRISSPTPSLLTPLVVYSPSTLKRKYTFYPQMTRSTGSSSSFLGLPSVADLIRATKNVTPQVALGRGTKRRHPPEDEDISPSTRKDSRAYATRASKRSRTDSLRKAQHELESSPVQSTMDVETGLGPRSPSNSPTQAAEDHPGEHEDKHSEAPYRTGFEPHAIGIWIAELLNDRFTAAAGLQEGDLFLKVDSMKQLSDDLTMIFHTLNPPNVTVFISLVYLERLLRKTSLKWTSDAQQERWEMVKRTFTIMLHVAFLWTDDVPWCLSHISNGLASCRG